VVDDESARDLRIAVGEQRQQDPLPAPRLECGDGGGDQHPAEQRKQGQPRGQAQPAEHEQWPLASGRYDAAQPPERFRDA
jgi:hypothetical protein